MKRWIFFLYGCASHLLFLLVFAYMAIFVGNIDLSAVLGNMDLKTIDSPASTLSAGAALGVNMLLLVLFALQHSVMARPGFKKVWCKVVPRPIERSTYVMITNLITILMLWQWQGMGDPVWDLQSPGLRIVMWVLFAIGWLLVPVVSLMIDHFDLFGTRQVWFYLRGKEYTYLPFRVPFLYRFVRHPLYVGWMMAFWFTPTMSKGHLLFAVVQTVYMVIAAVIEERDLVGHFGEKYETYRRQVPMFVPNPFATYKADS